MSSLSNSGDDQQEWISTSDLMAGLMVLFALIAILGLIQIKTIEDDIATGAFDITLVDSIEGVSCTNTRMAVTCIISDNKFDSGQDSLNIALKDALDELFPNLLEYSMDTSNDSMGTLVKEIIIEGHTSSEHMEGDTELEKYHLNLLLSQRRSANVMKHVLQMDDSQENIDWLKPRLSANGLSSRELKLMPDGREDTRASRRVEVRLLINDGYFIRLDQ